MRLIQGQTYTSDNSDLKLWVMKISYESDTYYKVKGILANKKNNIVYETKSYKLFKDRISHWHILKD